MLQSDQIMIDTGTIKLLKKLNILWYLCSLPDFWITDVKLPIVFKKNYKIYWHLNNVIVVVFAIMSAGTFFTQNNLTTQDQHKTVICMLASSTALFYRLILSYYKTEVRQILYHLTITLKEYNNSKIEYKMLRKIKQYATIFGCICTFSVCLRGVKAVIKVCKGELFITFVTMWPDLGDPSLTAEIARYIIYFAWCITTLQLIGVLLVVMTVLITISHQYKNLTKYFFELNEIFKNKRRDQEHKEMDYETGLRKGLQFHILTLWCVRSVQRVCKIIFNIHLTFGPVILIFILPEMLNPKVDTRVKLTQAPVLIGLLLYIGFIMWNAGDITVEASKLPDALFGSGWQHCRGRRGIRVRKMIIVAMQQAQQPVSIKAFGTFELSYESYVTIVKSSYSVFSVLAI